MQKALFILGCLLIMNSCSHSGKPTSRKAAQKPVTQKQDSTQEAAIQKSPFNNSHLEPLTNKQRAKLKPFFGKKLTADFDSLLVQLDSAESDSVVEKLYNESKSLLDAMDEYASIKNIDGYTLMEDLKFMDEIFGIRSSCAAECTEFVFDYDFKDWQLLSRETAGEIDDRFFVLKEQIQGETGGYLPGWLVTFERTWDYGGGVLLGDGQIHDFLKSSWKFKQSSDLFSADIKQLREAVIDDLAHPIYMFSKEKVQKELKTILKGCYISKEERKEIQIVFKRNEVKHVDHAVQFGCQQGDCNWGG
jgi:hypothetical protein